MTSNAQTPELLEPRPPDTGASPTFLADCISAGQYIGAEEHPERRDSGLWLLQNQRVREATWERLRQEYEQPAPVMNCARPFYDRFRRLIDVVGAMSLLVLLTPMLITLATCIRLESPGPAFFRQWRVGRNGRRFMIWKLRTMRRDAPAYARSPRNIHDRRITRMGRILRRTSLDEVPQLLNVVRGHMSLIGPRPEMPFIVARYTRLERQRLLVRPGMTGLWQIGPARSFPIHHNLQCDLHYIRNRNLLLDLAILLRTAIVVVSGNGPS